MFKGKKNKKYKIRDREGRRNPQIYRRTQTIVPEKNFSGFYKFLFITLLSFFTYVVLLSPALKIKDVEASGNGDIGSVKELFSKEISKNILSQNILFFSDNNFQKIIKEDITVKEAKVAKKFPNKIILKIQKREPKFLWEENENSYLIDNEGIAFLSLNEETKGEYGALPKIKNNLISLNKIGDKVGNDEFFSFINFLIDNFAKETSDKISFLEINSSNTEINVLTDKNYKVLFDATRSPATQLKSLIRVKEETKKEKKKIEYIDLRVETRIFYK